MIIYRNVVSILKIAMINTWAISKKAVGGTERFVMDLAKAFKDNGNEVDVYMFSGNTHEEDGVNYINIDLFNINGEADEYVVQENFKNFETDQSYLDLAKKLEDKINMDKYDFIQLNSLLFLEAWKNKKRIFTIHTNPFEYILDWGEESFERAINIIKKYRNNDKTIFVTPSKFYANEYSKLTACKINFIPHAIDKERLKTDKTYEEICNQYNLNKKKIKILVPQRLEPNQKQPQLVLEACGLMKEDKKAKFEIIYTGLDKQYEKFVNLLEEKARKNNINIKIIRFDLISEAYKIADICVLPSKSESFGYSALEALSLGIYTVLNDIPTFNELIKGNNYNYIFKNNSEELKNKILEIIQNKEHIERQMPSEKWQKQYDINAFEKAYINLIK